MVVTKVINKKLTFLILYFLLIVFVFGVIRIVFLLSNFNLVHNAERNLLGYAFFNRGILFDTITASYLCVFPLLVLSIKYLINSSSGHWERVVYIYMQIALMLAIIIAVSDIAYFKYYNTRINKSILMWTDDMTGIAKALFTDSSYLISYLIMVLIGVPVYLLLSKLSSYFLFAHSNAKSNVLLFRIPVTLVLFYALFIGIRGECRFNRMPTITEHAFTTPVPFINQLSINPLHSFLFSLKKEQYEYIETSKALANTTSILKRENVISNTQLAKVYRGDTVTNKKNVVLILVESMSAYKMSYYNYTPCHTPFLDSLATQSLFFPNSFSAGIHTHNGIFSALFGLPALGGLKATANSLTAGYKYAGLSNVLKERGYTTAYFCTNSKNFDNAGAFLQLNDFDYIFDESFQKEEDRADCWGVPDHILFESSGEIIDTISENNPFFAVYLTVSTHSPYDMPENTDFEPISECAIDKTFEYADWSLKQFFEQAKAKPWFDSTIFIITADHGQVFEPVYELPLSYHHVPLMFFSPKHIQPKVDSNLALQIDIPATTFAMLGGTYVNNTLGINLLENNREFAYFSADNKYGCLNNEYYYQLNNGGVEGLYKYKSRDLENHISSNKALAAKMKEYMFSMLQTTQFMLFEHQTALPTIVND